MAAVVLAGHALGCGTTVTRLDGTVPTSAGPARTVCEKESWIVIAPTRREVVAPGKKDSEPVDDGVGLYRLGEKSPLAIPDQRPELGPSPMLDRHAEGVEEFDRDRIIAGGLGAAGALAVIIGTVVFVNAFETKTTVAADGSRDDETEVNGSTMRNALLLFGAGIGLGISGVIVNPGHDERVKADASRYVFAPPRDNITDVQGMVSVHNEKVRSRCEAAGNPGGKLPDSDVQQQLGPRREPSGGDAPRSEEPSADEASSSEAE